MILGLKVLGSLEAVVSDFYPLWAMGVGYRPGPILVGIGSSLGGSYPKSAVESCVLVKSTLKKSTCNSHRQYKGDSAIRG